MKFLLLFENYGKINTKSNILKLKTDDINNYPTPLWFIDKLKEILRSIIGWNDTDTIDLCCNKENVKFPTGFTLNGSIGIEPPLSGDSLQQEWYKYGKFGWLASPYDKSQKFFIEKAMEESNKGMIIVALFQTNADSSWYKNYVWRNKNCEVIQLEGRLKYPQSKHPPSFGNTIAIFGIKRNSIPENIIDEIETLLVDYNKHGEISKRGLKKFKEFNDNKI